MKHKQLVEWKDGKSTNNVSLVVGLT